MTQIQASPALGEARGLKNEVLVLMTRPLIMQIISRFLDEVKTAEEMSPFIDRILDNLAKDCRDGAIAFNRKASAGGRFA